MHGFSKVSSMWLQKLLVALAAAYAVTALVAYFAQTWILFPASSSGGALALPAAGERITCETPDGERLHGVRISPSMRTSAQRKIVLGFGGNAWNAEHMAGYLSEIFPAHEVVTFHYRGYRPSTGSPSAAALLNDAPVVYDCATEGADPAGVVAVGFSIGTGPAVRLARERHLDGLILVTPFDSLEELARHHYGWLPVQLLLRHQMSPAEELRDVTTPVALIAAAQDGIITPERTSPLRRSAQSLVMDRTIDNAGHNDIYGNPQFETALQNAMRSIMLQPDGT